MGRLSPRWDVASATWLRAGRAIADRKNVGIASSPKGRGNDELAYPVGLETVQSAENVGALHAGGGEQGAPGSKDSSGIRDTTRTRG